MPRIQHRDEKRQKNHYRKKCLNNI
jgi:hypothetical protein